MHDLQTPLLGPGAAVCAWAGVVVALNLTDHPLVAAGAFAGLVLLALRLGRARLVVVSLAIGLSLSVITVVVALLQGTPPAVDAGEPVMVALAVLRVPAQVLAIVLPAAAGATATLHALARYSRAGAMLAALTTRMASSMSRDVASVRDELRARGVSFARRGGPARHVAAWLVVWEAFVSGLCDRAFATAAALDTRAYGARRVTLDPLRHPRLPAPPTPVPQVADAAVIVLSAFLVAGVAGARGTMWLPAPTFDPFAAGASVASPLAWALALGAFALGATPTLSRRTKRAIATVIVPDPGSVAVDPSCVTVEPGRVVLELRDLVASYPGASCAALYIGALRVRAGELVVVGGASGSGKSTLLDCVSGLMPFSVGGSLRGSVRIDGTDCTSQHPRDRAGRAALVAQHPERQVLVGSVAEEVALGPRNLALPGEQVAQRVVESLDAVGALQLAARRCDTLSAGELQRVLLAAALALEPAVLLLDEPTAQLDALSAARFWAAVDELRARRALGVIAVEHVLDTPLRRCDRVLLLHDGRVVAELPAAQARQDPSLAAAAMFHGLPPARVRTGSPVRLQLVGLEAAAPGACGRVLIRGLGAAVQAGAVVVVEGDNGVGKTTLLRAIRGLHPARGMVLVDGVPVGEVDDSASRIAWVGQHAVASLAGTSARACVRGPRGGLQLHDAAVDGCLAQAGLSHVADRHPMDLSVGERQRLAFAAATCCEQPVWLLDEPTRGMDATARRWIALSVLTHAARGGVCVVATHDATLARAVASHRLRLGDPQPLLHVVERAAPDGITASASRPDAPGVVLA